MSRFNRSAAYRSKRCEVFHRDLIAMNGHLTRNDFEDAKRETGTKLTWSPELGKMVLVAEAPETPQEARKAARRINP